MHTLGTRAAPALALVLAGGATAALCQEGAIDVSELLRRPAAKAAFTKRELDALKMTVETGLRAAAEYEGADEVLIDGATASRRDYFELQGREADNHWRDGIGGIFDESDWGYELGDDATSDASVTDAKAGAKKAAAGGAFAFFGKFAITGVSAMAAESATFPIDLTKTRMQLAGQGQNVAKSAGMLQTARNITKAEGISGLYRGIKPAIARHIPYTGSRIMIYDYLRTAIVGETKKGKDGKKVAPTFFQRLLVGFSSGAIAQTIAVPMDVCKVRMQADGVAVAAGKPARYSGLIDALRQITKQQGVRGLWSGSSPAVFRAAMVNLGELASYATAKDLWLQYTPLHDGVIVHTLSAIVSGFFAAVCSTPADVVKTRMMNQVPQADGTLEYRGMVDCFKKVVQTEGPMALYKGFFPGWARLGPWQLVFWVSYEQIRVAMGYGSF